MMVEIVELIEHPDGSATVKLDLDEKAQMLLIEAGFIKVLEDKIKNDRQQKLIESFDEIEEHNRDIWSKWQQDIKENGE